MTNLTKNRKEALQSDFAPLYAVAGLADAAYLSLRGSITATLADLQARQAKLEERARGTRTLVENLPAQARGLPEQLRQLPELAKERLAEAQKQATSRYADYAGRGKGAVDGALVSVRKYQARSTSRASGLVDDVVDTVADRIDDTSAQVRTATHTARTASGTARTTAARRAGGATTAAGRAATKKAAAKTATARTATVKKA